MFIFKDMSKAYVYGRVCPHGHIHIPLLSTLGMATVDPEQGLVYKIAGAVHFPVNAPSGGVFGRWSEIMGSWLMYPDQIHPVAVYLHQKQVCAASPF